MIHFPDYIQGLSADAREFDRMAAPMKREIDVFQEKKMIYQGSLFGITCMIEVSPRGLKRLLPQWGRADSLIPDRYSVFPGMEVLQNAMREGVRYPGALDDREWSPSLRAVLDVVLSIPGGETRTYGWVAARAGMPRGARAVGRALSTNPVPLVFPCHRVVRASGPDHGGYTIGAENRPDLKSWILSREREGCFY